MRGFFSAETEGDEAAKDFTMKHTKDTKDSEINTLTSEFRALRDFVVKIQVRLRLRLGRVRLFVSCVVVRFWFWFGQLALRGQLKFSVVYVTPLTGLAITFAFCLFTFAFLP